MGSNESGLLHQVVFKYRFSKVDLRKVDVPEQWFLKAGGLLIQVVSNTGLTVPHMPILDSSSSAGNKNNYDVKNMDKWVTII